jgi:ATP-dependent exoDNAse (exonuclease V) beta subunit
MLESGALLRIERRILRLIEDERFCTLSGAECMKEQMIRHNGSIGIIDLLVRHEEHWVIIDYKSGREGEEKHRNQVLWYKEALRAFGNDDVRGYLCYLLEEETEWVECL